MIYAKYEGVYYKASWDLERREYKCPYRYCTNPAMILKKGSKYKPHFAHKKRSNCEDFSEHETDAHIAMKEYLQKFLNIPDEYMEYGEIDGVRPDLVWQIAQKRFAIEVQHSPIQEEEIKRRNAIYLKEGIIPLWIFHEQELEDSHYYERGIYKVYHERTSPPKLIARRLADLTKLKSAERCIYQLQGSLCYLAFDSKYSPENPIFEYETFEQFPDGFIEPAPDNLSRFLSFMFGLSNKLERRSDIFHTVTEFKEWAFDYPGGKVKLKAQEQKRMEREAREEQEGMEREAKYRSLLHNWWKGSSPQPELKKQERQERETEEQKVREIANRRQERLLEIKNRKSGQKKSDKSKSEVAN